MDQCFLMVVRFLSFDAAIYNSTASDSCTFECWLWVADLNSARNIFDLGNLGDFSIETDGQVRVLPVNSNWIDTDNSVRMKSWHHIALVQESRRKDVYINAGGIITDRGSWKCSL